MILCQSTRGPASEGYWRWRIIDGRTCYYLAEVRVGKPQLYWGHLKRAPEVVVERKHYTEADLGLVRKSDPAVYDWDALNPLDQQLLDSELTPQQIIDADFAALGISLRPVLLDSVERASADVVAVAAVPEEAAATSPMLRNAMEIPLMLGVIFMGYLMWRGVVATFANVGRMQ